MILVDPKGFEGFYVDFASINSRMNHSKLFQGQHKYRIEDVYVGVHNGEFMTFAPRVSQETTDCLKITWWVYELDDDTYIALPGTGGGVTLNEKNTINVMDVSGPRELVFWSRDGDEESLAKFEKWYTPCNGKRPMLGTL